MCVDHTPAAVLVENIDGTAALTCHTCGDVLAPLTPDPAGGGWW